MTSVEQQLRTQLLTLRATVAQGDALRKEMAATGEGTSPRPLADVAAEFASVSSQFGDLMRLYQRDRDTLVYSISGGGGLLAMDEARAVINHVCPDPKHPDRKSLDSLGMIGDHIAPVVVKQLHLREITLNPTTSGDSNGLGFLTALPYLRKVTISQYPSGIKFPDPRKLPFLEELFISHTPLKTTKGIELAPALRRLALFGCALKTEHLEPISRCGKLEVLDLPCNVITALYPLGSPRTVKRLNVSGNPIETIEGIQGMVALEEVNLNSTKVTDYSPLLDVPHLKRVIVPSPSGFFAGRQARKVLAELKAKGVTVTKDDELPVAKSPPPPVKP